MWHKIILCLLLPATVALVRGEDFENALDGWQTTGGKAEASTVRFKAGKRSLRWEWTPGAVLEYKFKIVAAGADSGFGLWFYNPASSLKRLRVAVFKDNKKLAEVWFNLNFHGWSPLGADYKELGMGPATEINRLEFYAPEDVRGGEFFLDSVQPKCSTKNLCPDARQPWIHNTAMLALPPEKTFYNDADISLNRSWLPTLTPPEKINSEALRELNRVTDYFLAHPPHQQFPDYKNPGELEAEFAALGIHERNGVITGPPLETGSRNTMFLPQSEPLEFCTRLLPLFQKLGTALDREKGAAREKVAAMALTLCRYMLDQGVQEGSGNLGWIGNGYDFRYFPAVILKLRPELEKAGILDEMAKSAAWLANGDKMLSAHPKATCDDMYNYSSNLPGCLALIPDTAQRYQRFKALKNYYDRIILNPIPFGPDGTIYHHGGHHLAYGSYAAPTLVKTQLAPLEKTEFAISPEAKERLYLQARALVFQTERGRSAPNLPLRAGVPLNLDAAPLTLALSAMDTPSREMAARYLDALNGRETDEGKTFKAAGIKPLHPEGHLTLNLAAIALHRRADWLVTVAGMHKDFRGLEIYGWLENNNYGRFSRNGSVFVCRDGKDGYQEAGWNWNFWPGATSVIRSAEDLYEGYFMFGNKTAFAGGVSIPGDNGIWGMDFSGCDLRFKKSVFFFDNRITVMTSGIGKNDPRPAGQPGGDVVTTLFQQSCDAGVKPEQKGNTIRDPLGNGYYIWQGKTPLTVTQGRQEWTYFFKRFLKSSNENPAVDVRKRQFKETPLANNAKYYNPTVGEFALAYFNFGRNPQAASCAYTLLLGAGTEAMAAFAANPQTDILMLNAGAHVLRDRRLGVTGYVVFNAATALPPPLRKVSRPAFVAVRDCGSYYELSVAVSDAADVTPLTVEWAHGASLRVPPNYPLGNTVRVNK